MRFMRAGQSPTRPSPDNDRIASLEKLLVEKEKEIYQLQRKVSGIEIGDERSDVLKLILADDTIALSVNNQLTSLDEAEEMLRVAHSRHDIHPIPIASEHGMSVYRASLCYLLGMATQDVFPQHCIRIEHAFGLESSSLAVGYYCSLVKVPVVPEAAADAPEPSPKVLVDPTGHKRLSIGGDLAAEIRNKLEAMERVCEDCEVKASDVSKIKKRMEELVAANVAIRPVLMDTGVAVANLERSHQFYAIKLLESRNAPFVTVNRCLDFISVRTRVLAPRTGLLGVFDLVPHKNGMLLQFPTADAPTICRPVQPHPTVHSMWESDNQLWNDLEIGCVGDLNKVIMQGQAKKIVHLSEAFHDLKIVEMAKRISERASSVKMVLISGPSSSGKTTFASKLSIHLQILGVRTVALSIDDYYRAHNDPAYPRDSRGNLDYECIDALRLDLLNEHLVKLFKGEEVETPVFDFKISAPKPTGVKRQLTKGAVLICEGIFCLNPKLTASISDASKFKIYISPHSQLNLDEFSYFSNQMLRLIRRTSRDFLHRNRNAQQTLHQWQSVKEGEEKNIFPFMENADVMFNSSLEYEMSVLSVYVMPLLRTVPSNSDEFFIARNLIAFLEHFQPIPSSIVPSSSLLREFIGGSDFE
eukprot:c5356_g1_i2.p1 GENE.c5356_g1_i2~~c5356_g1_i2.p1  ORF type:complete len:642 (+),score=170.83 c5356_g1_i2:34-1959(+)